MKNYHFLSGLGRKVTLSLVVLAFGFGNLYAQHVFSVSYNELPQENARQMSMQIERARTEVAPLFRNASGEYAVSLSANQNSRIILLNAETGNNVVLTPTKHAPAEFVLSAFFMEELRRATLGDAGRLLLIEAGADWSVRNTRSVENARSVSRTAQDVFIPRFFYRSGENVQEALPQNRRIIDIFKERPNRASSPCSPVSLWQLDLQEQEESYFVYIFELPDGALITHAEHFVLMTEETKTKANTTSVSGGNLQFILSGNLNADQRAVTHHALNLWSRQLTGRVPVSVNVIYRHIDPWESMAIGISRRQQHYRPPGSSTWYNSALANQIVGFRTSNVYDIRIEMNSNIANRDECRTLFIRCSWNVSVGDSPGRRQYDWLTIMLHELAHGLGFESLVRQDGQFRHNVAGVENAIDTDYPGTFDRQLFRRSDGSRLTDLSPSERAQLITSERNLYAGLPGSHLLAFNNGNPIRMHAPRVWHGGSSVFHWYVSGTPYLMRTSIGPGNRRGIDAREVAIMRDMGWQVTISGPATVCCDGGTFTLALRRSETIHWSVTGFFAISNAVGNQVTIIPIPALLGTATGVLTARIYGGAILATKTITSCRPLFFTNQTVRTNQTITHNGNVCIRNVSVINDARLLINAAGEVFIGENFEVATGSTFEIR